MMMPSTSKLKQQERNWLDLPDPSLWRVINLNDLRQSSANLSTASIICKHAVDKSQGQLVDLTLVHDYNAELFLYVADRSSQLRRLEIGSGFFYGSVFTDALMRFPLLEELNLYLMRISQEEIETVCRYCPLLKTLKINKQVPIARLRLSTDEKRSDEIAIAIGKNSLELRHLELIGNNMTNYGLQVILDNCHHLETLDLCGCFNIDLNGDLRKNCSRQIKHLKLPKDSFEGCPYFSKLVEEYDDYDFPYVDTVFDICDSDYLSD